MQNAELPNRLAGTSRVSGKRRWLAALLLGAVLSVLGMAIAGLSIGEVVQTLAVPATVVH